MRNSILLVCLTCLFSFFVSETAAQTADIPDPMNVLLEMRCETEGPVYLFHNSADMNGDGAVNLADVGRLAAGSGAQCP